MKLTLLFLGISTAVVAQNLTIPKVVGAQGDEIRVDIVLDASSGKVPFTLKWEMFFPAQLFDMIGDGPEVGRAAKDSGKSISCALHKAYSYICLVFGGEKPIADGLIATFRFKIHKDAPVGETAVRLQQVEASGEEFLPFKMKDTEGTVLIR